MILYPFQPDLPFGYSVAGFDEEKKTPGADWEVHLRQAADGAAGAAEY